MLSVRIECRKREQRLPGRKTIRVETVVGKALLAVVIDFAWKENSAKTLTNKDLSLQSPLSGRLALRAAEH